MDSKLFKAILSMDSYNRGYNAGIDLPETIGTTIGAASIDDVLGNAIAESVGFYAIAYTLNGEKIISYRGTNDDGLGYATDINHGYTIASGTPTDAQAQLALDFYQLAAGGMENVKTANISLTGHSMGAGIAGFVAALYGKHADVFDNMPYESAAEVANDGTTSSHDLWGSEDTTTPIYQQLWNQIYGVGVTKWEPNFSGITNYYIPEQNGYDNFLAYLRDSALGQTLDINENTADRPLQLPDDVPITWTWDNKVGQAHDSTLIIMRMFGDTDEGKAEGQKHWEVSAKHWIPLLFDDALAHASGDVESYAGNYKEGGAWSAITKTAIAYSAINEGERVFGDTGIRALFDDANDLGKALGRENVSAFLNAHAEDISKIFVQYAGALALEKIESSSSPDAKNGVLEDVGNGQALAIDFSQDAWGTVGISSDKIITRDALYEASLAEAVATTDTSLLEIYAKMEEAWGSGASNPANIDRLIVATQDNGVNVVIPNTENGADDVSVFVGGRGDDSVTGSAGRNLVIGGEGTNFLIGGEKNDIIIGGTQGDTLAGGGGADVLIGGSGSDLLQSGGKNTQLYGGEGEDTFALSNRAFVMDATAEDHTSWAGFVLPGGVSQWWQESGFAYYGGWSAVVAGAPLITADILGVLGTLIDLPLAGLFRYAMSESGQLVIQTGKKTGSQLAVIEDYDWLEGTGGITVFQQVFGKASLADYKQYLKLALRAAGLEPEGGTDPLVIDIDGDGIELSRLGSHNSVYYDLDGNGFAENMGWVKPDDGFLVRDLDNSGTIDGLHEMFGSATASGFAHLAGYDSNGDGRVDAGDSAWGGLKVWRDADNDGVTDAGELLGFDVPGLAVMPRIDGCAYHI